MCVSNSTLTRVNVLSAFQLWFKEKKLSGYLVLFVLMRCSNGSVAAAEDPAAEQRAVCAGCHGADGNSVIPEVPKLAGQHQEYLQAQLQAFKSGARQNEVMSALAGPLSETDMASMSAYFSRQQRTPGSADPKFVSQGEKLYRGGNPESHTPACMACHGPSGHGNPAAKVPALDGQAAAYTAIQLRAYRDGKRKTDPQNMMQDIANTLQEAEIDAVAAYLSGLHD
jgi:cytochrome c553